MSLSSDVNKLWFFTVLFHVLASISVGLLTHVPLGGLICIVTLWVLIAGLYRSSWAYIFSFLGLALTVVLLWNMEAGYLEVFAVNAVTFMMVLAASKDAGMNPMKYSGLKRVQILPLLIALALTLCMIVACGYINAITVLITPDLAGTMSADVNSQPVSAIVVYAVLPAIVEEFMFRGCMIRGLGEDGTGGKIKAVVVSAFMFSLLHLNMNQMGYALMAGLVLGAVYVITKNLSLTVVMHLLFNLFTLGLEMLPKSSLLYKCMTFRVFGYAPLNAGLLADGKVSLVLLAVGTVSLFASLGLIFGLIMLLRKTGKPGIDDCDRKHIETKAEWKPNGRFWIGCIICILVAVIFEVNLISLMG